MRKKIKEKKSKRRRKRNQKGENLQKELSWKQGAARISSPRRS